MKNGKDWRAIVASSLAWEDGHASFERNRAYARTYGGRQAQPIIASRPV